MKLYYFPGACPLATHILLEWIGKPYETVRLTREQTKEAEYLALNPAGVVPTLVDGDFVLTENVAIMEYLSEQNPSLNLVGSDLYTKAEARRWLAFCNSDLHPGFKLLFASEYFSGGDASIASTLVEKAKEKLVALFAIANNRLKGRHWLSGRRSVADPYLYVLLTWAEAKQVDLTGMDELQQFRQRMEKDPAVIAARKAQGLD